MLASPHAAQVKKGCQVKGDQTLSEDPLPGPIAMVNTQQSQECPLNGFETVPTTSCERGPKKPTSIRGRAPQGCCNIVF